VHLRLCRTCGHVGCCDQSPNRHATKHFHATGHPIMEAYDPPDGWGWCYVDEIAVALPNQTPHPGPSRASSERREGTVFRPAPKWRRDPVPAADPNPRYGMGRPKVAGRRGPGGG
jgi:hypothetical protein